MNVRPGLIGIRLLLIGAGAYSVDVPAMAVASDWPQVRGPDAGVAADNPRLPSTWDSTRNVVWTTDIPGIGWSSPIVSGDHVFVTAVVAASDVDPRPKPGLYNGGAVTTTSAAEHRWVVYDRLSVHAAGPGVLHGARRANRPGDLCSSAHRIGCQRLLELAVGLQRQDLCAQRGRRYLCPAARLRVQGPWKELAWRDDARDPSGQ